MKKTSPVIKKGTAQTMEFGEAMYSVAFDDKKITRLEWGSNEEYGFMRYERLMIHTKGEDHIWNVSKGDIIAKDWVILPI